MLSEKWRKVKWNAQQLTLKVHQETAMEAIIKQHGVFYNHINESGSLRLQEETVLKKAMKSDNYDYLYSCFYIFSNWAVTEIYEVVFLGIRSKCHGQNASV